MKVKEEEEEEERYGCRLCCHYERHYENFNLHDNFQVQRIRCRSCH